MNTKDQTRGERLADLTHTLHKIRSLVGLCGLAAEARRTLTDIESATEINPALGDALDSLVAARREWRDHEDHVGHVLKEIAYKLNGAIGVCDELETES